jgi:predicted CXXCH cytochrome family protein
MCHLPLADEGNKGGGEGFEVYAMNSVVGPDGMGSVTRLCLSCHDGVGASGDVAPTMGGGAGHPVSVEYDRFSKDMHTPESVEAQGVKLHRSGGQYRVECTSCHSPHDNGNGKFLRISNQGSAMCLTCHDK